ncbi:TonB-dependent vitamin B12 receptor [Neiella marina]|uniref:TonB-dependent vitamin B12 receptor n=1 Tax=Neiella marina TaxID=508461 RepID=A0A8J2XME4_9GAMM|nr:TonB-dependent receptor [Neiella marina]GGA77749.1 TonB-dependent vitamin B12 receptor [Neiella marina]
MIVIGKHKRSLALAITTALATASFASVADDGTERLIVTGSRMPVDSEQIIAQVAVIDRSDLAAMQAKSIADALAPIAGVDIAQLGGAGQQSSVFTRGTNSNHTLILVDGVRVGSATLGYKELSTIPVQQIERIEVLKGPRAALWGSEALGGVIHIYTRRLDDGQYQLAAQAGSDSYKSLNSAVGIGYQTGSSTIALSYEDSDGFDVRDDGEDDDDGYDNWSAALRGDYAINQAVTLDWVAQLDDGSLDYDSFGVDNRQDYRNHLLMLNTSYDSGALRSDFTVAQSRDSQISFIDYFDFFSGDLVEDKSSFETRRSQVTSVNRYALTSTLTLTGGADWYRDEVKATSDFTVEERDTWAVFGHASYDTGDWLAEAALRYDDVEKVDSEVTYNASFGYRFSSQLTIGLTAGHAFKAPTFNDLYYPESFGFAGNPDLKPETSDSYELLLRSDFASIAVDASLYRTEIDDLIDGYVCDENWNCSPQNVDSATIKGGEVTAITSLLGIDHQLALSYMDATDDGTGSQLNRRPHKTAGYQASVSWQNVDLLFAYDYVGERNDAGERLKAYQTVDLALSYHLSKQWVLRAKADNVFDENYASAVGYNVPGAQYFLTVEFANN